MSLLELLVIMSLIGVGINTAGLLGAQIGWIGYPIGFIGGVALLFGFGWFLGYIDRMWRVGIPAFPECRNGTCKEFDYRYQMEDGKVVRRCQCGDQYDKEGRHFYFVNSLTGSVGLSV